MSRTSDLLNKKRNGVATTPSGSAPSTADTALTSGAPAATGSGRTQRLLESRGIKTAGTDLSAPANAASKQALQTLRETGTVTVGGKTYTTEPKTGGSFSAEPTSWPSVEKAQTDLQTWGGELDELYSKLETAKKDTESKAAELEGLYRKLQAYQADSRFGSDTLINSAYDNLARRYNELLPSYLEAATAHDSMAQQYNDLLEKYQSGYEAYTTLLSGQGDQAKELLAQADELEEQNKALALSIQQQSAGLARASAYGNTAGMEAKLAQDRETYATVQKQIEDLRQRAETAQSTYYASIPLLEDYAQYSQAGESKRGSLYGTKAARGDDLYDFINNLPVEGADGYGYRDMVQVMSMGTGQNEKYGAYTSYSYMTEEEIGVYNYLYAAQGQEAAEAFLAELQNSLNYRQGSEDYENLSGVGKALYWLPAGVDRFASGIEQLFSKEALPTSPIQYTSSMISQGAHETSPILGTAYDLGTTVSNMAPSILLGYLSAGLLGGAGVAAGTAGQIGGAVGSASMGLSAGGSAYTQKVDEGYTPEQARSYATLVGISEGALQYLLGGIAGAGGVGTEQVLAKLAPKIASIDNALLRAVVDGGVRLAVRGTAEGIEESLQEMLEPAFATMLLDEEYNWGENFENAAYAFLMGFLASGVIEGVSMTAGGRGGGSGFDANMEGYMGDGGTDYFAGCSTAEEVEARYKELAKQNHPDLGGDAAVMAEINRQHDMRKAWYAGQQQAAEQPRAQEQARTDAQEEDVAPLSLPALAEDVNADQGAQIETPPAAAQETAPAAEGVNYAEALQRAGADAETAGVAAYFLERAAQGMALTADQRALITSTPGGAALLATVQPDTNTVQTARQMAQEGLTGREAVRPGEPEIGGQRTAGTAPGAEIAAEAVNIENGGLNDGGSEQIAGGQPAPAVEGDTVPDGRQGRLSGTGTGEQAGELAAGAARAVRPAEQGRAAVGRQNRGKYLRSAKVSSLELGLPNGTETPSVSVVEETDWDEGLRATAERVYQETGLPVTYTLGTIPVRDTSGVVRSVRGVFTPDRIFIQADNLRLTTDQIADHEIFHNKAFQTPGLIRDVELRIMERYSAEEFGQVVSTYVQKLRGVVDLAENATPDEIDAAMQIIKEEIFADAYAGINAFSAHAERFRGTVEATLEERGIGRGQQNAAATDRTTGPPTQRYSYGGRNANRADSVSLARAEELENQGTDAEAIRQETGWHRGADGLWRFEMDDSGMVYDKRGNLQGAVDRQWAMEDLEAAQADLFDNITDEQAEQVRRYNRARLAGETEAAQQLYTELAASEFGEAFTIYADALQRANELKNASRGGTLADYIQHAELFANYPQLRNVKLEFGKLGEYTRGEFDGDTITLAESLWDAPEDTLIHEIQHAIQRAEGFASGASPEYWAARQKTEDAVGAYDQKIEKAFQQAEQILRSLPENVAEQFRDWYDLDKRDPARGQQLAEELSEGMYGDQFNEYYLATWALDDMQAGNYKRGANELYRNTAGEIEARDAASRRTMTPEQRRATPPDIGDDKTVFADLRGQGYSKEADLPAAERDSLKEQQLQIIRESNPAPDDYHTWIRSADEIKTFEEVLADPEWDYDEFNPDYTRAAAEAAVRSGEITVYSSYPIQPGAFVSPSRMEAESYSGSGRVYQKTVKLTDVAWIDPTQGQYAAVPENRPRTDKDSRDRELTRDQAEYFKDSQARDGQGRLLTLYHQTEGEFTVFDPRHQGAGTSDSETPSGIFMKPTDEDIGLRGKRQMKLYANITNPLTMGTREELAAWYRENIPGYQAAEARIQEINDAFGAEYAAAEERSDAWYEENYDDFAAGKISEAEAEAHIAGELDEILGRWKAEETAARQEAKGLLDDFFSKSEYDGIHLQRDAGSFGRSVETWIAFKPEQVKNIANRTPTTSPDIRFSVDEDQEAAEQEDREKPKTTETKKRQQRAKKPVAESLPIIAKRDLRTNLLNLFSIPEGRKAELGGIIDQYADRLLKNGELTQADRDAFFDRMYAEGVMTMPADEYFSVGREAVKGGKVYVSESEKHEFGDDWNEFRKRAFANGIYLTSNQGDQGVDQWNMELAETLPGLFDAGNLDSRSILERIVQVAEEGKDQKLSLAEYAAELAGQEYVSEDEILDNMERQMDWALRTFAEKAKLEVHLRDRTGVKIAQEREKFSEAARQQRERELVRQAKERDERKAMQQRHREHRELRELQERTIKQLQWLSKNRWRASEELQAAFDEVLGDIDIYAVGAANEMNWSRKYEATWKDLAQLYKTAKETDPNFLPSKELEKIVARLDGDKIADLNVDALQDLYRAAVGLRTEFYNRNNVINDELNRIFEEVYADSKREIETAPGGYKGKGLDKFMNLDQLTPMNVMQRMGGWNPQGAFYSMAKQLERGERDIRAYTVRANRRLEEFLTEYEDWVKKADGQGKDGIWYEVEVPELLELGMGDKPIFGPTIKVYMTPSQKVHMYLESKSYDNLRHMTGGRTFVDRDLYSQGKRQEAFAQGRTIRLAPETVKGLVADLTEEEAELARILEDYYNNFAKGEINRVSNILYGYDKAQSRNYAPIFTNRNYVKSEIGIFDTTAEGVGHLKARQFSKNPSYNISAFDAFERHVEQTARFVGMSIPARNWQTLLNWREKNNSMGDVITHKWGEESKKYIEDLLNRLQGGAAVERDTVGDFADKVLSNYISAVFGANPSIVLKQLGSIPLASAYLGGATFPSPAQIAQIDRDLIAKYTGDLAWRTMGYSTPETKHLKENPNWTETNKFTRFTFGGGAITAMDGWAASVLWPWAENKVRRDFPDLEVGTQEQIDAGQSPFYKKVAEEFNEAVARSQSVSDEIHQGTLRKSRNPVTRAFTMFKSDSAQGYNALRQKIGEAKYYERSGDAENARRAKKAVGVTFVSLIGGYLWASLVSFLIALWKNKGKYYRDDEGELTFESVAKEMVMDLSGSLVGIVAGGEELMDILGNVLTGDTWYGIDTPGLEQLTDIIELLQKETTNGLDTLKGAADVVSSGGDLGEYLRRHGNDILGGIKELAEAAGTYIQGVPVSNLEAYILGGLKWISPELGTAYDDLMATAEKSGLSGLKGDALEQRVGSILSGRLNEIPEGAAEELAGLYEAGYTQAVLGDTPAKITVNGEGRNLGAYQQQVYETVWRESVAGALGELLDEDWYQALDSASREKVLAKLYDYGMQRAKATLFDDFEPDSFVGKIGDFEAAGLSAVDYLEAWRKSTEIEDSGANASGRATEFAYWADTQGYTAEQSQVVKDSFTVFSHLPVEPERYSKLQEAGLSDSEAKELTEALADLEPLEGAASVSDMQRLRTIAAAGLDQETMQAAMGTVLGTEMTTESGGKSQYAIMLEALDAGYTVDEWLELKEAGYMTETAFGKVRISGEYDISPAQYIRYRELLLTADALNEDPAKRNNSVDQDEAAAAINGMLGLTNEQKAVLWQLQNKSWKANKNPFDSAVGQEVYDYLNTEELPSLGDGNLPSLSLPSLGG